jgi:two-component system, OmpR family, response regulator CpxR
LCALVPGRSIPNGPLTPAFEIFGIVRAGFQVCPAAHQHDAVERGTWTYMKPKRTILCVDDDERSLSIRKVILETRGYRVLTCCEPETAIDLMRRGGIDLVLTDLMMPKLNGARLIDQMKAIAPDTPALLFSGSVTCCNEEHLADVWLPKGEFAPMELLERIRVLLIRKRGPKRSINAPTANRILMGNSFSDKSGNALHDASTCVSAM